MDIVIEFDKRSKEIFIRNLESLRPRELLKDELGDDLAKPFIIDVQVYPPPPKNSQYIRTYNFKNNWEYTVWGDGLNLSVWNSMPYGRAVMGDELEQLAVHVGRWRDAFKVFKNHVDHFVEHLIRKVEEIWRS